MCCLKSLYIAVRRHARHARKRSPRWRGWAVRCWSELNCPSLKRLYKPCNKLTEGKCPLYGIGFNFMDARYYDTFATVGGNRVSS